MHVKWFHMNAKESSWQRGWLFLFIAGLCGGIIFANAFSKQFMSDVGIISHYMLDKLKVIEPQGGQLMMYCLEKRILPFLYIAVFGLTMFGLAVIGIYIIWLGFSMGVIVCISAMRFGAGGILLVACAMLPHYVVYVPALLSLMKQSSEICSVLYFPRMSSSNGYSNKKQQLMRYFLSVVVLLLVCIMGVLLESYVNPVFVKKILQFF